MSHDTTHWIEVIRLRSATADLPELVRRIAESFANAEPPDGMSAIRFYLDPSVGTDLCIHLHLQTAGHGVPVGDTGEQLARALEDHGLVDRTLWVEAQRSERKIP